MGTLMSNVFWAFGEKRYATYEDFVVAVTDYNKKVNTDASGWDPNKQISTAPLTVVFEAAWRDEDDMIEVAVGESNKSLSMGEVLFTLNNATVEFFKDAEQHFFEGLAARGGTRYELLVGS